MACRNSIGGDAMSAEDVSNPALHARICELEDVVDNFTFASGGGVTVQGNLRDGMAFNPTVTEPSSADGGGGGGADNLETVTGAVNGVPSTLNVQTDGAGWTAI